MLGKLQQAGVVTERQLVSPTMNREQGLSCLPDCGTEYGPFRNMECLASFITRLQHSFSSPRATVRESVFQWKDIRIQD
ncbi:hypothetical protein EDB82DRAFT_502095 [Fusarium venenatum]|uniref:uncharacterized protein n=1 Tax=Fusarium venenatum TaxID=56646 RepID=UPI001D1EEF6F|nr:hypothetical protein EDB82DRAFT_502095 [Fusarium venenatum]